MRAGLNQYQTLACILCLSLFFIAMNLILNRYIYFSLIVVVDVAVWMLFHTLVNYRVRKQGHLVFLVNK
jgi:hypothetical protein